MVQLRCNTVLVQLWSTNGRWTDPAGLHRVVTVKIGAKIRKARAERGLSRRAFSKMCGVSVGTLNNIETGKVEPHPSTVKKLLESLASIPKLPSLD